MAPLDWAVVVAFLVVNVVVGLWFSRRAGKSTTDFFVAGRSIPWWLAGTSMLATSFASDTPLHTTRAIREGGIAAAWFYWGSAIGGLVVAFVFAKLWRRAGVVTDNEFIELRYTGRTAAALRGGLALFKAFALEILTLGWITLGMTKIVRTILDLPVSLAVPFVDVNVPTDAIVVSALMAFALLFSAVAGLWAVVATDVIEFSVAMLGAIVLCIVAVHKIGGIEALHRALPAKDFDVMPHLDDGAAAFVFAAYLGVQWWANNEIDGTGQRAQRFLACKDEKNAIAAGVWNMAVQWIIRSWPWYVAALCSLVLYPQLDDAESAYPKMVADLMPIGLKGLMVASFFAALMGTMESHYNLTASYAINDVYARFLARDRSPQHYVRASRVATIVVAIAAGITALLLGSVLGAFRFKMELVAGVGLVYVLRWLWWRTNALTEIAALVVSIVTAIALNLVDATSGGGAAGSAARLVVVVALSSIASIIVALTTKPEPREHLAQFYARVRPPRALWGPIADDVDAARAHKGAAPLESSYGADTFVRIAVALGFVFCSMIGIGKLVLGDPVLGGGLIVGGVVCGVVTIRRVLRDPV